MLFLERISNLEYGIRLDELLVDDVGLVTGGRARAGRQVAQYVLGSLGLPGSGLSRDEDAVIPVLVLHRSEHRVRYREAVGGFSMKKPKTPGSLFCSKLFYNYWLYAKSMQKRLKLKDATFFGSRKNYLIPF